MSCSHFLHANEGYERRVLKIIAFKHVAFSQLTLYHPLSSYNVRNKGTAGCLGHEVGLLGVWI
jgi:hypothetical protein